MLDALVILGLFTAKVLVLVLLVLFMVLMLVVIASKARSKSKGRLVIKHLNEKLEETKDALLTQTLGKAELKAYHKKRKNLLQLEKKTKSTKSKVYVLNFHGDLQASAVGSLREEITAILTVATPHDEVVVCLESGGGMVHAYGLGASELQRIRDLNIPLTVMVDKIAASGGYLMAAVADRILAAPFAIIGSIGVVFQLPNFHRVLTNNHVEFEQITAGNYKRTLTVFGKNTEEGREKLREELETIHNQFKDMIKSYRPSLDLEKVATGEHWLGQHALGLKLIDGLMTSDQYLVQRAEKANVYEVVYERKKTLVSKLKMAVQHFRAQEHEPLLPIA